MFGDYETRAPVVLQPPEERFDWAKRTATDFNLDASSARVRFREFLRNFRQDHIYIYRESLLRHWNRREFYIDIDLAHLNEFDEVLFNYLQSRPSETLVLFEAGAKDALKLLLTAQDENQAESNINEFQIILKSQQNTQSIRSLTAEHVNCLIKVPGIVISCSKARSKAIEICVKCTKCQSVKKLSCKSAIGGVSIPNKCDRNGLAGEDCGSGTYVIMADQCDYIDQQTLKLQEAPEVVPTGEMPRNILLIIDRYLVDRITPGTRVSALGIVSLFNQSAGNSSSGNGGGKKSMATGVRTPYLRVLGLQVDMDGSGRTMTVFTPQEEEEMQRLARDPDIYGKLARSIAPQISGEYTVDLKKAIACLLMGGSRKILPDGVRLRGDINILLMGDPSTAKSQFLKFVEKVAPIGVYTSGKGSSAAGLTASVIKDAKGEFFLEGGAMVLADGGVICIDEFDKMRETDRVAIHEAMEQQTISIAKAGITTMLNCRNSVLAAANPIHGRYDDSREIGENINLMTTILSRFDCIFIVRDVREQAKDREIARHVLGVHINASLAQAQNSIQAEIPAPVLKKYIAYCRERCAPRLNQEAAALLSGQYVHIRNQVRENALAKAASAGGNDATVVPITIRQLEAIVRLSEALAKMRLSVEATVTDVEEALRLFKVSTFAASQSSPIIMSAIGGSTNGSAGRELQIIEEYLKRRIGLRMTVSSKRILEEAQAQGYAIDSAKMCIRAMVMRNELQELHQGKIIRRLK